MSAAPTNVSLTQITPTKILGTIPFVAGTQQILKIDRSFIYRSLNLRLTGNFSTSGASTAASLSAGDEWAMVKSVELIANGGNTLRFITGEQLVMHNFLLDGYIKDLSSISGTSSSFAMDSMEPLSLCMQGDIGKTAIDTQLNATLLDDLYLRITWGQGSDVNASFSSFTTTPQIEVCADMAYFIDSRVNPAFNLTQIGARFFSALAPSNAGNSGNNIQLPVSQVYDYLIFNSKTAGTKIDNPNSIGTIVIQSGVNQFYLFDSKVQRRTNAWRGKLPGITFTSFLNNTSNSFDAWTVIKFPQYVLSSESFNTRGFQNCDLFVQNALNSGNIDLNLVTHTTIPTPTVTG